MKTVFPSLHAHINIYSCTKENHLLCRSRRTTSSRHHVYIYTHIYMYIIRFNSCSLISVTHTSRGKYHFQPIMFICPMKQGETISKKSTSLMRNACGLVFAMIFQKRPRVPFRESWRTAKRRYL